jgi:hypothetical protein
MDYNIDYEFEGGFAFLTGKTIISIEKTDGELFFTLDTGDKYKLYHEQDCCESVYIEDICGDLDDLLNAPILLAEEVSSPEDFDEEEVREDADSCSAWTFYKMSTIKGSVTIRWFGSSNGYYSVGVSFDKIKIAIPWAKTISGPFLVLR